MTLYDGMQRMSGELRALFRGSTGIEHLLSRGEFREGALAEILRPQIPLRFALSSGEVVNDSGRRSKQQDVLVTDSYVAAPFLSSGRLGVHPVESVYATLQIKSRLDAAEVADAIDNVASVKLLLPDDLAGLKQARLDPEARVRLEVDDRPYPEAVIEGLWVSAGFLSGATLRFSENITCLIGGTGPASHCPLN